MTAPAPAIPNAAQAVALGAKYGPTSALAFQRSQYLADALARMQADSANIRTPTALWASLLADGITQWGKDRADREAMSAYGRDREALIKSITAGTPLDPSYQGGGSGSGPTGVPPVPGAVPQVFSEIPSSGPVAPVWSEEQGARDRLARMMWSEARGEGDDGMLAVGSVALNRAKSHFGGAKTLADVLDAPNQFEGLAAQGAPAADDPAYRHAGELADALLGGKAADPTRGAVHFLNPDLQASLGRQQPDWAPAGGGMRIGHHVFYGGSPAAAPAPAPGPYQVAALGSPPAPPAGGAAPAVSPNPPPQAAPAPPPAAPVAPQSPAPAMGSPAGGGPPAPSPSPGAGGIPLQQVTPQEWAVVQQLLQNPQTFEQGLQMATQLKMKAASPVAMKPGTYWGPDGKPHSVEQMVDVASAPNSFVQRSNLDGSIHATANPAYGALPPSTAMDGNGAIRQVPIAQQPTFRIPGANGIFVNGPDGRPVKVGDDQYGPEQLMKLRSGVLDSDAFKNFQAANDAYGAMVAAAQQPNGGMRAYALRDTFARLINPGAVARVGTIQAIHDAQGVPANIQSFFMNLKGDGNVPPDVAQQILDVSRGFLQAHYGGIKALNDSNIAYAKRHGVDPEDVIAPLPDLPPRFVIPTQRDVPGGPPAPAPMVTLPGGAVVPRAALEAEARRRGLSK